MSKQFLIRHTLLRPSDEHSVKSHTLHTPKLLIRQIGVMDNFCDGGNSRIAYSKLFSQGFKSAIISPVAEPLRSKHIERNRIRLRLGSCGEREFGTRIDKA